jgi:hypothetical protein
MLLVSLVLLVILHFCWFWQVWCCRVFWQYWSVWLGWCADVTGVTGVAGDLAFLLVLAGLVLPCILVKLLFLVTLVEAITYTLSTLRIFVCKTPMFLGESTVQYYVY